MVEALRIGVVGTGAMGRNHVRLLSEMASTELVGVHDRDPAVAEAVARRFDTRAYSSLDDLADGVEAIVLAVPTIAHVEIGCELLERGVDLLVEKPIAPTVAEADELVASSHGRILAVGHVEFFNPAVEALISLGLKPRFAVVERLSSFTPRSLDVDVVLDLMIHDLQILQALDGSPLREVRAAGVAVLSSKIDIASARLEFESGCVANVTASRVSAERVRSLRVFLKDRYYSLDYAEQTLTGFLLREPVEDDASPPEERISPVDTPIKKEEPLRRELARFVAACQGEEVSYVDGVQAREALACGQRILDAIP